MNNQPASGLAVLVRSPGPRPRVAHRFTPAQGDQARLLIADGGIVPHPTHPGVFRVVSSSGDTRYLTSPDACTCPAGKHDVRCYHSAAAALLLAGSEARAASNEAARYWRRARVLERQARVYAEYQAAAATLRHPGAGAAGTYWRNLSDHERKLAASYRELARAAAELARQLRRTSSGGV